MIEKWKKLLKGKTKKNDKVPPTTEATNSDEDFISKVIDPKLTPIRNGTLKVLAKSFLKCKSTEFSEENTIEKIKEIEKEMFDKLEKDKYVQRAKAIASNISDDKNEDFRNKILDGTITPSQLVTMDEKDMYNKELIATIKKVTSDSLDAMRSDWDDKHAPVFEGEYTCGKCGSKRCVNKQLQTRSADEPMTNFVRCIDCGHSWKFC
ncbi:MAG: hypothetical protein MJ252_02915 [archaeon]|nr:hypothetical protein [archaeon]